MTLLIGGKPAKATARKLSPPESTPKPIVDPAWGVVNADPFHVDTDKTPEYRASYLAECGRWASQGLDELAALARKAYRLDTKLRCLPDNPHRPDAVQRSLHMEADMIQRVRDLVMQEAESSRVWASLSPSERKRFHVDYWWDTEATEPVLIGATWFRLARSFEWPIGFALNRLWMSGLPIQVLIDLRIHKVYKWDPNPRPELFPDSESSAVPINIARQITDEKGNPR